MITVTVTFAVTLPGTGFHSLKHNVTFYVHDGRFAPLEMTQCNLII